MPAAAPAPRRTAPSVRLDLAVEERSSIVACGCGRAVSSSSYLEALDKNARPPARHSAAAPAEMYAYVRRLLEEGWTPVLTTACDGRGVRVAGAAAGVPATAGAAAVPAEGWATAGCAVAAPGAAPAGGAATVGGGASAGEPPVTGGASAARSEERRVGKECRSRWWTDP